MGVQSPQSLVVNGGPVSATPYVTDPNVANSLLAWTHDPSILTASGKFTPAAATIYLTKVPIPYSITITNLTVGLGTGGTAYTDAQLGLYSSAGTYLSSSAVQASAGTNGFGVTNTMVTLPLAAAQAIVGSPTAFVWAALHAGTNSATAFTLGASGWVAAANNVGTSTSTLRSATYTGHATNNLATIGNLTPASMTSFASMMWVGIS